MVETKEVNVVVDTQEIVIPVETEEIVIPIEAIGTQGEKGDKGDTALTVSVGSVTTGETGTNASVTNSGTTTDLILDFIIPKGAKGDKGDKGETGLQGPQGPQGEQGTNGEGVPSGGTTGQVLAKQSDNDYDTIWINNSGGSGVGTTDYTQLENKPKINNIELTGNKSLDDLGIVNFSGNYEDLSNKPTIPTVPTDVSSFNNDAGYLTSVPSEYVTETELNAKGYLTEHQDISNLAAKEELHSHANKTILDNIKESDITNWNNKSSFSGNYDDLENKPTIPTVPDKVSAFENDAGYLTEHQSLENKQDKLTASDGISIDENGNIKNTYGYQDNKLRLWTYCIPRATVNTLEELETALVSKFQEMLDAGAIGGVKWGTNLFVLSDPNGTDGAFTDYVGEYLIYYVESSGSLISLMQISTIDKFFHYLSTKQSNNSLEMYDHAYINITTSYDESSSKVIVNTVSLNKPDEEILNVLATDKDYTTPYMPLYNGSPTTKKYVDDNFINKNQIGVASGVASLDSNGKVPSSQLSNVVESGSNSNGSYVKYSDGTMICYKTVEGTVDLTEQYYTYFYHTADSKLFNLGDYAMPFIERPICNITFIGGNAQWIGAIQNQSATHVGDLHIISVTSKKAGAYYDVIAVGKWK